MCDLSARVRDATTMTSTLKHSRPEPLEASISAVERQIAERNERIILDLIRGRDTSADEEKVVREAASLANLRRRRGGPTGRTAR
jgi:hypothetical protein